ncbi:PrsW family intramembrane metalloprotease [Patescibacteria group bacterium]|nr:PrsW family intramembrane metalloprotease [Patescibacteria group bacterium]
MQMTLTIASGIIPALIWLWFWLKEDAKNPEPKKYILMTFIVGMLSALFAVFCQGFVINSETNYSFIILLFLSTVEEISKFVFAYFTVLRKKIMDEPIDAVIYMITVALGFAAMENILYLWTSFGTSFLNEGLIMTNMRFIGATVLHTASSGIIGVAIALTFYRKKITKIIGLVLGVILSIGLHTAFNFLIINNKGESILNVFVAVWIIVVILLMIIEKIKKIKPKTNYQSNK